MLELGLFWFIILAYLFGDRNDWIKKHKQLAKENQRLTEELAKYKTQTEA